MARLVNRAGMTVAGAPGAGTITLGGALSAYQSFATAGVRDGDVVSYEIEDGSSWELGRGTYAAAGLTLTRAPTDSSNGGAAITASAAAVVYVTALADDIQHLYSRTFFLATA